MQSDKGSLPTAPPAKGMAYHAIRQVLPYGCPFSSYGHTLQLVTGRRGPSYLVSIGGLHDACWLTGVANDTPMTRDTPDISDWDITTDAAFESALKTLLLAAMAEGLDPRGAWAYRNGDGRPDLEVIVTELAKQPAVD